MSKEQVDKLCSDFSIRNYKINDDLSVDTMFDVIISHRGIDHIPIKFNKVAKNFCCHINSLTSFKNCPNIVFGNFYGQINNIKTRQPLYCLSVYGNIYADNKWKF